MCTRCTALFLMLFVCSQITTWNSVFARPYYPFEQVLTECHDSIDYTEAVISEQPIIKEWLILPQIVTYEPKLSKSLPRLRKYTMDKKEVKLIKVNNNNISYPYHPMSGGTRLIRISIERLILPTDLRGGSLGLMFIVQDSADRLSPTNQRVFTTNIRHIELSVASSSVRLQIVIPQTRVPIIPARPIQLNLRYSCIHAEPIEPHTSHLSVTPCTEDRWDEYKWVRQLPCRPAVYGHLSEIQCISVATLCDGTVDCPTAEDEATDLCELQIPWQREQVFRNHTIWPKSGSTLCGPESYSCDRSYSSGEWPICVPLAWACDGLIDCPQGEDEQIPVCSGTNYISGSELCPKETYPCVEDGQCLPYQMVCDNRVDCLSGFDEIDEACEWRVQTIKSIVREQQLTNSVESTAIDSSATRVTTSPVTLVTSETQALIQVSPNFMPSEEQYMASQSTEKSNTDLNVITTTSSTSERSERTTEGLKGVKVQYSESNGTKITKPTEVEFLTTKTNYINEPEATETVKSLVQMTTSASTFENHDQLFTSDYLTGTKVDQDALNSVGGQRNMTTFINIEHIAHRITPKLVTIFPTSPESSITETMQLDTHSTEEKINSSDISTKMGSTSMISEPITEDIKAFTPKYMESGEISTTEPAELEHLTTQLKQRPETRAPETDEGILTLTSSAPSFDDQDKLPITGYSTSTAVDKDALIGDREQTITTFPHAATMLTPSMTTEMSETELSKPMEHKSTTVSPIKTSSSPNITLSVTKIFTASPQLPTPKFAAVITTSSVELDVSTVTKGSKIPMSTPVEWNAPFTSAGATGNCTDWAVCRGTETLFNITHDIPSSGRFEEYSLLKDKLDVPLNINWISRWLVTIYQNGKARCPGVLFTDETNNTRILVHTTCLSQPLEQNQIQVLPTITGGPIINASATVVNLDEETKFPNDFRRLSATVESKDSVVNQQKLFGIAQQFQRSYANQCHLILQHANEKVVNVTSINLDMENFCLQEINSDLHSISSKSSSFNFCLKADLCSMLDSSGLVMCARSSNWTNGDLDPLLFGYVYPEDPCTVSENPSLRRFRLQFFND